MSKKQKIRNRSKALAAKSVSVSVAPRAPMSTVSTIDSLSLRGFKSHRHTQELKLRPLTILAGENSGGKSSIVQPLLLMKQTLEAQYDPGVLDLRGACVNLDRAVDLFWTEATTVNKTDQTWSVRFGIDGAYLEMEYGLGGGTIGGVLCHETRIFTPKGATVKFRNAMSLEDTLGAIRSLAEEGIFGQYSIVSLATADSLAERFEVRVLSGRCAHGIGIFLKDSAQELPVVHEEWIPRTAIERMIHLPGLRGNPERAYRVTRVGGRFPGVFQNYTASVLEDWQENKKPQIQGVREDLASLRLTRQVKTVRIDDTRVEVRLGRRLDGDSDLVNIADVGFGASQALPVVVALRVAETDQLVHIEQPELHLHPNAQVAMAGLLIAAARRGARLIVETHSSVMLKALQVAIAEDKSGKLRDEIALHWFARDESGASIVKTADLGLDGSVGDWPVDFADVEMDIHRRFIQASSRYRRGL